MRVRAARVRGAGHEQALGAGTVVNAAGAFAADVVRLCGLTLTLTLTLTFTLTPTLTLTLTRGVWWTHLACARP